MTTTTKFGTWNLERCGKLEELSHELEKYKWNLIGLSEIRWKGIGEVKTNKGHKIYSGHRQTHIQDVALVVNKEL